MDTPSPIYTVANSRFAAPLQWSVTLFWRTPEHDHDWLPDLETALESDQIRILNHRFLDPCTSQLLLSTLPATPPTNIVQRTKGRLYYLVRDRKPKPFRGNFSIRSIGKVTTKTVEDYVADQLGHHRMADPAVQSRLSDYQINDTDVDLKKMQRTSHGVYWYNLHLVFAHRERWMEIRDDVLRSIMRMIPAVAHKKSCRLSRAAILPDHIHLVLGCPIERSPATIALDYLNNLAFAQGLKPVYEFGGFIGTIGEYTNKAC